MADNDGSDTTLHEEGFTVTENPGCQGDPPPEAPDEVPLAAERPEDLEPGGEVAPVQRYRRRLGRRIVPVAIAAGTALMLLSGGFMVLRAEAGSNAVALASQPKPVSVMDASEATFRGSRSYVGTIEPWVEAKIGPVMDVVRKFT